MQNKMIVLGSGLVGSLWAYILKKRGFDVELFEKRPDPRELSSPAGRSINLVITSRGLRGLEVAGLLEKILPITVPVYGRRIHPVQGETLFQPYGRDKSECNYSVSRWELNKALIEECRSIGIPIHFDNEVDRVDVEKKEIHLKTSTGNKTKNYTRLFATDGAGSAVRKSLLKLKPNDYQEQVDWLDSDYKELNLPTSASGESQLENNDLHIWPRGTHIMMGLANADQSFTMTLYLPRQNHRFSFDQLQTKDAVEKMFASEFPDVIQKMPRYTEEFLAHPQGRLATVRLNKWVYEGSIAFLGDAAHAIVPFFGQGMNLGFEDCTVLAELMEQNEDDWVKTFEAYDQTRRPNANAIADMALENFTEMRDKVGDPQFQFKKKLEALIEKQFPELYRSRYGLITYTLTPYRLAYEIGVKQSQLLDELAANLKSPADLNFAETKFRLENELVPWAIEAGIATRSYRPQKLK